MITTETGSDVAVFSSDTLDHHLFSMETLLNQLTHLASTCTNTRLSAEIFLPSEEDQFSYYDYAYSTAYYSVLSYVTFQVITLQNKQDEHFD